MKGLFYISILTFSLLSCQTSTADDSVDETDAKVIGQIYVNEYGQVELNQLNDTLWQTVFTNNEGHVFDTSLAIDNSGGYLRFRDSSAVFLPCNWGGINFNEDELFVTEFSSYGLLGSLTQTPNIYERSFYRLGKEITFQGDVWVEKDGPKANGMYFKTEESKIESAFYNISGTVKKEKYPVDYYSTDESPQGKFGNDTTVAHYRLVLENPSFELPETFVYEGSKINNSNEMACLAWDWADSESYVLNKDESWPENELGERIKVEGYLAQGFYGSHLKNWKIID